MAEINIGAVSLTNNQISRMSEAGLSGVRGYKYKGGEITVNHENETLSAQEITDIKNALEGLPDVQSPTLFNTDLMTYRIGQEFTGAKAIQLAPYLGALQSYSKAQNFLGAKDYVNGLQTASIATAADVAAIKSVFTEQGVDLDSY